MKCPICGRYYRDESEIEYIEQFEMCTKCDKQSDEFIYDNNEE